MSDLQTLIDEFLGLHWAYHPIDATFAGAPGFDDVLPPADAGAAARERAALQRLGERLERTVVPNDAASRLDTKLMRAQIAAAQAALGERPRFANPVWYTGEVAFGLISLLLAPSTASEPHAFVARLAAVPDFLAAASTQLSAAAVPADWVRRARLECAAIERLLAHGLPQHPYAQGVPLATVSAARAALQCFYASLESIPDADPACGTAYLALLVREVHGLAHTPESLEREAAAAYGEALAALCDFAARLDNNRNWREQLAALAEIGPAGNDVLPTYRAWHERAMHDAYALVSPAREYALEFAYLPDWARPVASDLYFLFYRSPAPYAARSASTYWVAPPGDSRDEGRRLHNTAAIKQIHAVHHGSIGHHTQNARARSAPSRLARVAGTDCAAGIMFLGAGTMVEGWACYAEDLLAEISDFYSDAERLQLAYFELRNIACCLADIRLHTGTWTLDEMRRFYRDGVGFAPSRVWSETTRNSIFPGSRLMYWTGAQQIKALRARSPLPTKSFHDALLAFGAMPVAWIAEELAACSASARC